MGIMRYTVNGIQTNGPTLLTNVLEHILVCFWKWGILQDTRNMAQYGNMLGETWWASGLPIFGVWEATNRRSHFKHEVAIKVHRNMVKVGVFGDVPGHMSVATSEIQLRNLDPGLIHTDVNISWWRFKSTMRRCLTYSEIKLGYQCLIHDVLGHPEKDDNVVGISPWIFRSNVKSEFQ